MWDDISGLARQVLAIFGITHPIRLGVAFCLGEFVKLLLKIAAAYHGDWLWLNILNETPAVAYWIIFSGFFMVPVAFGRGGISEDVKRQIFTIEEMIRAAGLVGQKRAMVWHGLISRYLESIKANKITSRPVDLHSEASTEIRDITSD